MIGHPVHDLREKPRGSVLTADEFNRVLSAVQAAMRRLPVPGFASNVFVTQRTQPRSQVRGAFPGQVYAAMNYAPNRWIYALREVVWDMNIADWGVLPEGRTTRIASDDFALPALNGCEAGNDGTGLETIGIDFDGPLLGFSEFEVIEIKNLPVVPVFPIPRADLPAGAILDDPGPAGPAEPGFWFSIPNVVDGDCAPPPKNGLSGSTAGARAKSSSCSCSSCGHATS